MEQRNIRIPGPRRRNFTVAKIQVILYRLVPPSNKIHFPPLIKLQTSLISTSISIPEHQIDHLKFQWPLRSDRLRMGQLTWVRERAPRGPR
jgi:hypothetical protein